MRASVIATLIFIGLIGMGMRGMSRGKHSARVRADEHTIIVKGDREVRIGNAAKQASKNEALPRWQDSAAGEFKSSSPEAVEDAMHSAAEKVARHLRSQTPPIEWTPSTEFVRKHMVRNVKEETRELTDSNAPLTYRANVEFEMTESTYRKVLDEERKYHAEQRMAWLARVFGGLVLILVAIAGYVRLDDVTKGFYSIPLRVAAIILGLAGAVVVAISVV